MIHFRSLGYSSLLAIAIAAPASAQMTPESTWTLLQDYMTKSGAEVAVGDTRRDGDRMVLSNVTLNASQPEMEGKTTVAIPEIVLRDIGDGKVEITSAPESTVKTSLTDETGETIETELKIRSVENVTIASGSPEQPVFDFTTKSFEMVQSSTGLTTSDMKATISGETLSGHVKLDLAAQPQKADYTFAMGKLNVLSTGEIAGEEGEPDSGFEAKFELMDLKGDYAGVLPDAKLASPDLPALEGKLAYATGPMKLWMRSTGASPMAAAFLSSSSKLNLDFAASGGTFSYMLNGIDVAESETAPATASATHLTAKGSMTVPAGENGTLNLEGAFGKVTLELSAVSALFDRVVAAKLASAEDMAGIQMMMGFFTRPGTAEGSVAVDLEQTQDGKMLINGEEMP